MCIYKTTEDGLVKWTGFDDCIIGMATNIDHRMYAYDYEKMVKRLMTNNESSREDAEEHINFNILGTYVGEHTPVVIMELS